MRFGCFSRRPCAVDWPRFFFELLQRPPPTKQQSASAHIRLALWLAVLSLRVAREARRRGLERCRKGINFSGALWSGGPKAIMNASAVTFWEESVPRVALGLDSAVSSVWDVCLRSSLFRHESWEPLVVAVSWILFSIFWCVVHDCWDHVLVVLFLGIHRHLHLVDSTRPLLAGTQVLSSQE